MAEVYVHRFNGISVRSGDVLCTHDGVEGSLFGQIWRQLGRLVPGEIDHCLIYTGPGGWCIESGVRGVIRFEMPGEQWNSIPLSEERMLCDVLIGAAFPLEGRMLSEEKEVSIRSGVIQYCLQQVEQHKPYNINFFNPNTDRAFYCSQLVYKAYLSQGINLNTNQGLVSGPLLDRIVCPDEIWNACPHQRASDPGQPCPSPEQASGSDQDQLLNSLME